MTVSPARQGFDLILNSAAAAPIGLMLIRHDAQDQPQPAQMLSKYGPSNEAETAVIRDVGVAMDDFSGGFGYSQRWVVPNTYAWAEGVCTRWPRIAVPAGELTLAATLGAVGRVTTDAEFGGDVYWATNGGKIYKSTAGTGTPTQVASTTTAFTQMTKFNGSLYVAGNNGDMWKVNSSGTVSQLTGIQRDYAVTVWNVTADNVGANRIWGVDPGAINVRYCSGDPAVAGNWSSNIQVGDSTDLITHLVATNRHVFITKVTGIHDLDELGNSPNLTPYWVSSLDPGLAQQQLAYVYDGYIYASQGRRGLERLNLREGLTRRDVPDWCHPGFGVSNETPIQGWPTAIGTDQGWLVLGVYNPSNNTGYLMYGKDRPAIGIDGPGPILWHGAEMTAPGEITNVHVAMPTNVTPIMWVSTVESGTAKIYKLSLPRAASPMSDILWGGTHRFNTSGKLYLTPQDWGQEYGMAQKQVNVYDLRADNLGSGKSIALYSSADSGAYTLEGTATASGRTRLGPTTRAGYNIALRADLTSTATSAAIFRGVRMLAGVLAEQDEYAAFDVEFGWGVPLRGDGTDRRDAADVKDALIALQDTAPFTAIDPFGRSHTVRMAQGISFEALETSEEGRWRMKARFLLRYMDFAA